MSLLQLEIEPHPAYVLNPEINDLTLPPNGEPIGLDIEMTGDTCWRDKIRVIAIHSLGETYLIIPEYYKKEELVSFFERVRSNNILIISHNAKFDTGFIYTHYGVVLTNIFCTMVASQVLRGGSRKYHHDLASVLLRQLNIRIAPDKAELQKSFIDYFGPLSVRQLAYAADDCKHLIDLRQSLINELERDRLMTVIRLEMSLIPVLVNMEAHGCLLDIASWKKTLLEWEGKKKELLAQLDAEAMRLSGLMLFCNINYGSPKQLLDFFRSLGLPVPIKEEMDKKTKENVKKESVDEDTLDQYLNENPGTKIEAFLVLLKDYREYEKLLTTYGESFLERVDANGYIHCSYGQTSTTTGRLNSKNPNLQNLPSSKSGAGGLLRDYFIAPPGYKIITSDMSGAEVALAADFSKDDLLLNSLKDGVDMHSKLATISAKIIYNEDVTISKSKDELSINGISIVPNDFREIHKSVTFSKFYKGGPKRVYGVLARYISRAWPPAQRMNVASQISKALDDALPKLTKFLTGVIQKANANGYLVTTKLGRRRYFDTRVYGDAANAPIQGSNADAIKIAMVKIHSYLMQQNIGRIVLSVHDEVVCIVRNEFAVEAAAFIRSTMADSLGYFLTDVKGEATVKIGSHWEK